MEDFTSPNLQLVLGVKEGTNFDRVQKPTVIIATLNGHCLETKKIQPDCNPQYTTDLTWETDKNSLRKMRCNQTPIKVECYAVNENGSREKLGYILLSVRCAQIIHRNEESKIKITWHNILGVRNDFNHCKPKLLLYLIIKEKESRTINTLPKNEDLVYPISATDSKFRPVWQQEEHLIQLGPLETCQDIFILSITVDYVKNLDKLDQELRQCRDKNFAFCFDILNTVIKLKPFKWNLDQIFLEEKISVKIRTSASVLSDYLNTMRHFIIHMKNENYTIAQSEVNLKSIMTTNFLEEFRRLKKDISSTMEHFCILQSSNAHRDEEEMENLPHLKLSIKLQLLESRENSNRRTASYLHSSPKLQKTRSQIITVPNHHNIEEKKMQADKYREISTHQNVAQDNDKETNKDIQIQNDDLSKQISSTQIKECHDKSNESHRSYCFSISLNSIKFLDSKPNTEKIEFRFYHQKGDLITAVSNNIAIVAEQPVKLKDVKCILHFVSSPDEIDKLLTVFAPKINICDATSSERKCIARMSLDIKKLFINEKLECQYEVAFFDCHSRKEIGCVDVSLALEDFTMSSLNKIKEGISGIELDNSLAYKIVDELETWKERQKEIFKDELKRKEESHLTLLNEEWQRRRKYLETKLGSSIEQCKILASNLNKTVENLRLRKIQSLEKETKLIQANEELQWKYDRKLHQLQDALQRMQGDFTTKLVNLEEENKNLVSQVKLLTKDKYELEKVKVEQTEKLNAFKKVSLTEDQTTSVLQQLKNLEEKLDNAQKSKSFFKEQWGKAVREIHRIKIENQQALESQIKNSKEELHNINLEEILHADSAALTYDQIALNEIQREIDILNPDSRLQHIRTSGDEQLFLPSSELCTNSNYNLLKSDISTNSSESDRKLNMLIEERDMLLKTGTYKIDDSIIINLNTEIRSILMNS